MGMPDLIMMCKWLIESIVYIKRGKGDCNKCAPLWLNCARSAPGLWRILYETALSGNASVKAPETTFSRTYADGTSRKGRKGRKGKGE